MLITAMVPMETHDRKYSVNCFDIQSCNMIYKDVCDNHVFVMALKGIDNVVWEF